jgi:hypothetical protein
MNSTWADGISFLMRSIAALARDSVRESMLRVHGAEIGKASQVRARDPSSLTTPSPRVLRAQDRCCTRYPAMR